MFFSQERINFDGISHWYLSMHPHILATVHSQTRFLFQQRNIAIAYMAGDVATCSYPQLLLKARTRVDYIHNHVQAAALSPMATLLVLIIMGKEKDP